MRSAKGISAILSTCLGLGAFSLVAGIPGCGGEPVTPVKPQSVDLSKAKEAAKTMDPNSPLGKTMQRRGTSK
jgi:hypothetical protein